MLQDGSNGKPANQHREHAGAQWPAHRAHASFLDRHNGETTGRNPPALVPMQRPVLVCTSSRAADQLFSRSASDRGTSPASIRFPPGNFKHSLTLFSKSFSSFPRGTCSLSVSRSYLALDGIYHPIRAAFPNNPTRRQRLVVRQGPGPTGLSPSQAPPSRGLGPGPPLRTLLQTTIQAALPPDFHAGLFPVRSPLLGESL